MISIILPAKNSEKTIKECLESIVNQNGNLKYELIIIEDGSIDRTREISESFQKAYSNIDVLTGPGTGPAGARNIGIEKCKGDIVVFIDSDCVATPDWLYNLVKNFLSSNIWGVCGSVKTPPGLSLIGQAIGLDWEYRQEKNIIQNINWFHAMNTAYRRELFNMVGLMNDKLITGEDVEFSQRAMNTGKQFIFDNEAIVYHHHRQTLREYLKQFYYYGKGNYTLFKISKDYKLLILPTYFTLVLLSLIISLVYSKSKYISLILIILGLIKYLYDSILVFTRSNNPISFMLTLLNYTGRFSKYLGFISELIRTLVN